MKKKKSNELEMELVILKARLVTLNDELDKAEKNKTCGNDGIGVGFFITPYDGYASSLDSDRAMQHMACKDIKKEILKIEKKIRKIEEALSEHLQPNK